MSLTPRQEATVLKCAKKLAWFQHRAAAGKMPLYGPDALREKYERKWTKKYGWDDAATMMNDLVIQATFFQRDGGF